MSFLCRKAVLSDLPDVLALRKEVIDGLQAEGVFIWDDEYPSESLFHEDIEGGCARLLVFENRIAGYTSIGKADEEFGEGVFADPGLMTFSRLMVARDFRRMGGGRCLVEEVLMELAWQGVPGVGILVHPVNEAALRFYEKLSFENLGPVRNEWGEFVRFRFLFT